MKRSISVFPLLFLGLAVGAARDLRAAERFTATPGPVGTAHESVALRSLQPVLATQPFVTKAEDRENPLEHEPGQGRDRLTGVPVLPDALAPRGLNEQGRTPTPFLTFAGTGNPVGCGGCSPPDTVGDVGPNHYVQMVNATKVTVFSKDGTTVDGPYNLSDLFGSGNCDGDAGDPVVNYDPLADRWVLSQFAGPSHLCFAVSTTPDPLGTYFVYTFATSSFPDYFKVGVWPDGYYVGTNESNYSAWVFEREAMLAQDPTAASLVASFAGSNFLMPADVDGILPPPAGAPGYFYTFLDNSFHGGADRLELYTFDVNWSGTPSGTFTTLPAIPLTAYNYTVCNFFVFNCAPQGGTAQKVDVVSEWPMFRLAYRNFGASERLAGNFAVNVGAAPPNGRSGIRWFELGRSGGAWTLAQEGTYDPGGAGFRYMGSSATDHFGNAAIGYTFSSSTESPDIRIASRLAGDPAGTLGAEVTMTNGTGSQTGSNRWGDYSALSIDPADDCTFWYTNEYYVTSSSSSWSTRVGAFRIPQCGVLFLDDFETAGVGRWDLSGTK